MLLLGISAFYHDSSAAIVENGEVIAAVQEERFTRIKHDSNFPNNSIKYLLSELPEKGAEIEYVVFYEKPFLKFERLVENYIAFAPRGYKSFIRAMPLWLGEKLFQKKLIIEHLANILPGKITKNKLLFSEHHLSHAASAFYPSPFHDAAILTIDGVGEWATTTAAIGHGNDIQIISEIHYPHSLGLLYSAFSYFTGFKVNSGEYKLMGLAPYGVPEYVDKIKSELIDIKNDGSFRLNFDYFDYCTGLTMTSEKFNHLFDDKPRTPDMPISQKHMNMAASIQHVTEEIVVLMARHLAKETEQKNLCLAGGVALNCVANGKLLKERIFDNIWIQPASGDAGGSIGSALVAYHHHLDKPRIPITNLDGMKGGYLGPQYKKEEIQSCLDKLGANYEFLSENKLIEVTASSLGSGKAVGWFQGKMEFGPRALGARSILADPRDPKMQKQLNLKIKYRESFRPFAPAILAEDVNDWFDIDTQSPYMLFVAEVLEKHRKKSKKEKENLRGLEKLYEERTNVPAITHVDLSARIQTVHKSTNKKFHSLISKFKKQTGCPMVVNTSFNVRGEPIVCSPEDAFKCFMGTDLDILVIENFYLEKSQQNKNLIFNYEGEFEPD